MKAEDKTKEQIIEEQRQRIAELEKSESLRKQAQQGKKKWQEKTENIQELSNEDIQSLVHELQAHQIELEMQNDVLYRAQNELKESSNRYLDLYDFAPISYFTFNTSGLILDLNLTGANKLGVERSLLIKTPFSLFVASSSRDVFNQHLRKVFRTRTRQTCEIKLIDKNRNQFDARLESLAVQDSENKSTQCRTAISDITEHKRAAEELRKAHDELELRVRERTAELEEANKALMKSEASYRELTESIDDLFYAMNRDLKCIYWNKASEALTGISAKDAIGKSLYELFPEIKETKAEQFYIEALKTQRHQRFENEYQLGDKKFNLEINVYPSKDGLSIIAKDITEKKRLESQLLRSQRMESIGTLAGGIAHDLNNLMTPMMMSLHMLKEKLNDEKSQKLITILEQNSQRSADLIKQVLSFGRGVEGERNPLQVKHIIIEIEKIIKETFPRNIEIRTDIPKDLFTISGDATQLHQVIMNLCVNSRDAMSDGGILSISAENFSIDKNYARMHTEAKVGSYVVISISDTGTGIPPKNLDRIFEPFFTTKEFGKGTGLGLSTALAIVKSHGRFIDVQSEVGKGTTFKVYFPAIKTEIQEEEGQKLEMPTGNGEFILVAEDEGSISEFTSSTLETYGYKVLMAQDGAEAVALYANNKDKIKVVLMDLMMPVMDGQTSIRAIRKINPEVKIIAVSGLAEKDKLKNVANYTNAFLPKPYTTEKLLKTIHEVLSNH